MELQATTGGRGLYHLVAQLEDGDFVMYQEGSWCVDSVVVGPGDPPRLRAKKRVNGEVRKRRAKKTVDYDEVT